MPVVDALFDWGYKIYNTFLGIVDWFGSTSFDILGKSFTVIEVIIGGGLVIVLGYLFVKFVVPT